MTAPPRWFIALVAARMRLGPHVGLDELVMMIVESGRDWRFAGRKK